MRRREFCLALAASRVAGAASRLSRANLCFITDEVSRNVRTALQFAAEYGVRQVELRNVYGKYCLLHDAAMLRQIHALLREHGVRVAVLATPILKCILPGSRLTARAQKESAEARSTFPIPDGEQFGRQMEFLRKAIDAARILETDQLRIFSYWQVENPDEERGRILDGLRRVTDVAEKEKIRLAIENEPGCNLATCAQTMSALREIRSPWLGMAWDVVNGVSAGETSFPDGFRLLDVKRVWHLHIKDSRPDPDSGRRRICAVGDGDTPYHDIFRALGQAGYTGALSMETHFSIDGSREAASRRSMEGLIRTIERISS